MDVPQHVGLLLANGVHIHPLPGATKLACGSRSGVVVEGHVSQPEGELVALVTRQPLERSQLMTQLAVLQILAFKVSCSPLRSSDTRRRWEVLHTEHARLPECRARHESRWGWYQTRPFQRLSQSATAEEISMRVSQTVGSNVRDILRGYWPGRPAGGVLQEGARRTRARTRSRVAGREGLVVASGWQGQGREDEGCKGKREVHGG